MLLKGTYECILCTTFASFRVPVSLSRKPQASRARNDKAEGKIEVPEGRRMVW